MVSTLAGRRMLRLVFCVLVAAFCYGLAPGKASAAGVCPDSGPLPAACTKEIRVYNNTDRPLWAVVQGSIQQTDALGCLKSSLKGGGDVWLQAALGKTDQCLAVTHDYYIFINPVNGIPKGGFAAIKLPWWSKQTTAADQYIDWWRGGRLFLFDDKTAFDEAYNQYKANPVTFAAGSPKPRCNTDMTGNACSGIVIDQVKGGAIRTNLPFQLNEYTFADVAAVTDNGTKGGKFIGFNQGYNVSNVDQIYLPLAMEPVRQPADVGYMGTTMSVAQFRTQLNNFAKAGAAWPVYNNPVVGGKKKYPNAGVRIPATYVALIDYMNPGKFPDGKTPLIVPASPPGLFAGLMTQWDNCTKASPVGCPQSAYYKAVDAVFRQNYKHYFSTCNNIPDFLKPVGSTGLPKKTAYLAPIYGWVPFEAGCSGLPLPVAEDLPPASRSIVDFNQMQYNYEGAPNAKGQWFNPYTHLIHAAVADGGLDASAYAFSIDDHASYLNRSGGSLPGGLIFAVGGSKGLLNGQPHAPPLPEAPDWFAIKVGVGAPTGAAYWTKYGICSQTADIPFETESKREGFTLGIDSVLTKIDAQHPCPVTLQDSKNRKYQFVILKAQNPGITLPQKPVWPAFIPKAPNTLDPAVVSCPTKAGFVAPAAWCKYANELSKPQSGQTIGEYSVSVRGPLVP